VGASPAEHGAGAGRKPKVSLAVAEALATGGFIGRFPFAPATAGSAVASLVFYFLPFGGDSPWFFALIGATAVAGVWATHRVRTITDGDPRRAVIDEFAGMWVTCLFVKQSIPWVVAAFITFRVLDIVKPWPIRRFERLPGGLGIVADDIVAGAIGAVLLNCGRLLFVGPSAPFEIF
jgi:phosphatidylglycerophosphatase A